MARPANTSVIQILRKKILSGAFEKTSFLPAERVLAQEYGVGRSIIRGVLRSLEKEEIVYKVPKRGWRLREREENRLRRIILRLPSPMRAEGYECMGIVAGICSGANDIYAEVILSSPPMHLKQEEILERYNAGDIQGIIFLESAPDLSIHALLECGVPCVIANLEEESALPCVRMDYRQIGRNAALEILRRGYRKNIAVYSGEREHFIYRELLAGFREVLSQKGICLENRMIFYGKRDSVPEALKKSFLLPAGERPEVFFTLRDYRAETLYQLCSEHTLRIPEDVGIISYDRISWPGASRMGLYSIGEEVFQIGLQSVRLLEESYRFPEKQLCSTILSPEKISSGSSLKRPLP